jgi:hypothetical protein
MLTALEPPVRVTLATRDTDPVVHVGLTARGVEVIAVANAAEGARWLASRAGHTSVVVVDGLAAALGFLGALDAHPGAALVYDLRGPATGEHAVDRLVEGQVVALASVVLVPSAALVPFVRELSGGGDAVVADGANDTLALAQAFALVGLAVPDVALR